MKTFKNFNKLLALVLALSLMAGIVWTPALAEEFGGDTGISEPSNTELEEGEDQVDSEPSEQLGDWSESTPEPVGEPTEDPGTDPAGNGESEPSVVPAAAPTESSEDESKEATPAEPTEIPEDEVNEAPSAEPTATPAAEPTAEPIDEPDVTPETTEAPQGNPGGGVDSMVRRTMVCRLRPRNRLKHLSRMRLGLCPAIRFSAIVLYLIWTVM